MALKQTAGEHVKTFAGWKAEKGWIVAREPKGAMGETTNMTATTPAGREPVTWGNIAGMCHVQSWKNINGAKKNWTLRFSWITQPQMHHLKQVCLTLGWSSVVFALCLLKEIMFDIFLECAVIQSTEHLLVVIWSITVMSYLMMAHQKSSDQGSFKNVSTF